MSDLLAIHYEPPSDEHDGRLVEVIGDVHVWPANQDAGIEWTVHPLTTGGDAACR